MGDLEESSQTTYAVGQRRLLRFALEHNLDIGRLLPLSNDTLMAFATWLYADPKRLEHKSIKSYLCHVKHLSSALGLSNHAFACPRLRLILRSIRKARRCKARATRLPITIALLRRFAELSDLSVPADRLIFAALTVGVHGLMRSGELAIKVRRDNLEPENLLTRSSVTWHDNHAVIHLAVSKTDPFREGTDITIYGNGATTCPFAALRATWDDAPKQFPSAPLFQHHDGTPLRYEQLNAAIKRLATSAGLDPQSFSGHSLRIGGATSLAMRGFAQNVIQALGRWQSLSVQLYTRLTGGMREQVSKALADPLDSERYNLFGGVEPTLACKLSVGGFYRALALNPMSPT